MSTYIVPQNKDCRQSKGYFGTPCTMALTCLVAASECLFRETFENNFDLNLLGIKGTPYSFMGHEFACECLDTSVFSDSDALVTKHAKCFCWQERTLSLWSLANSRHWFISRKAIYFL